MQIIISEITGAKMPWRWSLRSKDHIVIGGRAKTRERAEQAARKASRMTKCCRCGEWKAGGGHRFCRPCLLWQLDQPINRTFFDPGNRAVYTADHLSPFIGHTNGNL